ncbi:PLP-dependent cysteine synthase family protein [Shouchella lonarensis]|uniref:O-acetylserine dependent cystathionine beta-synthase n=1 Tax=Shouchella lonarensis TaxID=1464122 RepID=A0A1G6N0D3_9BACI|nr:cysteine synthase family protein [Shouchella lonarensis]SDC61273.1 O-acetylserine dependent cystathionine beta-synthase [Shouchella lonarensis]
MIYKRIQSLIGETPLFEISRINVPNEATIYAKLEFLHPGGSVKDRLGVSLLNDALARGKITETGTLIEPTAGNTGIGLALAAKGTSVSVICVVPKKFSQEKQTLMRLLGATVVNTPTEQGMKGAIAEAERLVQETPDAYSPAQFANAANPKTYYETMAPEILQDLPAFDTFVAGAGSAGTFTGCATYFRAHAPNVRTVIVEPEGSILNGGEPGPHRTEGIGMEFIPDYVDTKLFDGIHTILDEEAFKYARLLAEKEGLLVAGSSGAAFAAAWKEAENGPPGQKIVTVFPDSSERYISSNHF